MNGGVKLPTDIQRLSAATQELLAIETPQDAIRVMGLAELARRYARTMALGTEAENAATAIRLKAEVRLAETVTEGQQRGEIATSQTGHLVRDADQTAPATLADLGVSKQRLSEARDIARTMGPGQIDALVAEADSRGQTLSRTAVLKEVRHNDTKRNDEFHERAEAALFTDAEKARRALDPVLLSLVPTAQVIREWKDYLTEQDRHRIEQHVASLVDSIRKDAGLEVIG